MKTLLVINTSPQDSSSLSRRMTEHFVRAWTAHNPDGAITYRELGNQPIPHVDENWISAAFTPSELRTPAGRQALSLSDELVVELQNAESIVIGCPMYNLSIPSSLKAYFDQAVRIGITTTLVPDKPHSPYEGLLLGKKAYLMLARGGYGYNPGGCYAHMNFQDTYLKEVLRMIGIDDVSSVSLEYTAIGGEAFENELKDVEARINKLLD